MSEQQASKILSEIEEELTNGKGLLRYTSLDLVQFSWYWEKEKEKGRKMHECIKDYIPLMERRTAKERLENVIRGLNQEEE